MWGFELDKADGKVVTSLVRVYGNLNIVRVSGARNKEGKLRFFAEPLRRETPPTVQWVSKEKDEEDDAFADRALRRPGLAA